jgi:hypothetical protein
MDEREVVGGAMRSISTFVAGSVRGVALTLFMAIAFSSCGSRAAMPPDSAPADVVLRAYLSALLAGDCDRAHAFATPTFTFGNGELCGGLHVSAVGPVGEPAAAGAERVFAVTLTTSGDGVSIRAGEVTWFYSLVLQSTGAWRLVGGGSGP